MTPIYQTKHGPPDGNCTAACVATLLDKRIEDVDVDVASCGSSTKVLLTKIEEKAKCKIYGFPHEGIVDGVVKSTERYCIVSVCSCVFESSIMTHLIRIVRGIVLCVKLRKMGSSL